MRRGVSSTKSAPSLRAQTAPAKIKSDAASALPAIPWATTANVNSQGDAESLILQLKLHSTIRSTSPPRPGSSAGRLFGTPGTPTRSTSTPYLLGGVTNSVDYHNKSIRKADRRIPTSFESIELDGDHQHHHHEGGHSAEHHEQDFHREADIVEKNLHDMKRRLENFEGSGSPSRSLARSKSGLKNLDDGDDDEDMFDNIRERFEIYKMCRKIEPELPPLVPLPRSMMMTARPCTPIIDYNWSEEAVAKHSIAFRKEQYRKTRTLREERQLETVWRRDQLLENSREGWEKTLLRKTRQAEDVMQYFREGAKATVSKEVVAEKWLAVYAMAAFMNRARHAVAFNQMPAEEKSARAASKQRKAMRAEVLDNVIHDSEMSSRLLVLTSMYRKRIKVKAAVAQANNIYSALCRWQKGPQGTEVFLSFKRYMRTIRRVQEWWRRKAVQLKEIRDDIARRWEKLERIEVAKAMHLPVSNIHQSDLLDSALRNTFLENELRSRRYFILSVLELWKEESLEWRMQEESKKALGIRENSSLALIPHRPSYLPPRHLFKEYSEHKACPDWCAGRRGDEEILRMVRIARHNPEGYKKIPHVTTLKKKSGNKKKCDDEAGHHDAVGAARMFSDAYSDDDLKMWGVDPSAMPSVGQKPGAHEGEGRYP